VPDRQVRANHIRPPATKEFFDLTARIVELQSAPPSDHLAGVTIDQDTVDQASLRLL
jgi:hypothetical protein